MTEQEQEASTQEHKLDMPSNDNKNQQKHLLNDTWVYWQIPRGKKGMIDHEHYKEKLQKIKEFNSVEEFFDIYCNLKRPSELSEADLQTKVMVFRKGYRPAWEENTKGGAWIIVINKNDYQSINQGWEAMLLACLGESFEDYNIIGAALSIRAKKNMVEIWIKNASNYEIKMKIGEKISSFLNIDIKNVNYYFKNHAQSLKELSSLQNAETYELVRTPMQEAIENKDLDNNKKDLDEFTSFTLDQDK